MFNKSIYRGHLTVVVIQTQHIRQSPSVTEILTQACCKIKITQDYRYGAYLADLAFKFVYKWSRSQVIHSFLRPNTGIVASNSAGSTSACLCCPV
jgi:hypothetical protein